MDEEEEDDDEEKYAIEERCSSCDLKQALAASSSLLDERVQSSIWISGYGLVKFYK